MQTLLQWLRKHLFSAFLLHQLFILLGAVSFLTIVRRLTGKTIHLGQDPIGFPDGIALVVLSLAVIFLTNWYYRLLKGPDAPSLGIEISIRRFFELVGGFIAGAMFFAAPLLIALWQGTASVTDTIGSHFDAFSIVGILTLGFVMLFLQAAMEETANRAFPMRIWEHRSLIFKLLLPSLLFVILHLVSESFEPQRAATLLIAGIVQGLAYALTGNIWFPTGLHFGANVAGFSMSGLWHMGAVVNVAGPPAASVWTMGLLMLVLLVVTLLIKERIRPRRTTLRSASA